MYGFPPRSKIILFSFLFFIGLIFCVLNRNSNPNTSLILRLPFHSPWGFNFVVNNCLLRFSWFVLDTGSHYIALAGLGLPMQIRGLKRKFLFSLETQSCPVMLFWKPACGRMFCWRRHVRICLAGADRHAVVFGSCLVKRHVLFCWSRCFRGRIFRKKVNVTPQAERVLAWVHLLRHFAGFHWPLLVGTSQRLASWYPQPRADLPVGPGSFCWIMLILLIPVWWHHWAALLVPWRQRSELPQRSTSKQVHTPQFPINLSFLLPLEGGLEWRLKCLITLIK